jgi:hypothetical protein
METYDLAEGPTSPQSIESLGRDAARAFHAFVTAVVRERLAHASARIAAADVVCLTFMLNRDGVGQIDVGIVERGELESLFSCDMRLSSVLCVRH